jgi:hypothetical protein
MGTLAFYDPVDVPVGSLDGLTLILETDLAGPVTVTFAQPTSPVHVATQINTQGAALGLVASCDTGIDPNTGAIVAANVGKLLLVRPSGGTVSLTIKGAGTANAILGLPLVDATVSGAGTVNDGASRIGLAAFGSWAGGTLQSYLQTVVAAAVSGVATKVAKAGDTMTGDLTFAATKRVKYSDSTTRPARGRWVLSTGVTDLSIATGGGILAQTNTAQAVVSADYEFYPITGDTITGIAIAVDYNGVPHGGEPGTKPTITLYKWPVGDATPTIVSGPVTDPETVAGDYENPHEVAITGASEVVNDTTKYFLRFTSEDGANQEAGYRVTHVLLTTTSGGLPPGL